MNKVEIEQLLEKIHDTRIIIYGDFCIDAYWIMDPRGGEDSVETGLKAEAVARHYYTLGGAANVAANVAALKPAVIYTVGVVGDDIYGHELLRQLQAMGIDTQYMIMQKTNFDTYAFGKRYIDHVEQPRIDYGFYNQRSKESDLGIMENLKQALSLADVLVFNQQVQDSISEGFIESSNRLFSESEKLVVVDSRQFSDRFVNVHRKMNESQACKLAGLEDIYDSMSDHYCRHSARALFKESGKPVLLTREERGMMVADSTGVHNINGLYFRKPIDPVGAGDSVLGAYALALATGAGPLKAAEFANLSAGVTIQKRFQTGTATGDEILALADRVEYNFNYELAQDIDKAQYLQDTEIEICVPREALGIGRINTVIFDHDGSVSTLREGADDILSQMMMQCILGEENNCLPSEMCSLVRNRVSEYLFVSDGLDPLSHMESLTEMIKEFERVPLDQVLSPREYLKIYNKALMEPIRRHLCKIEKGEMEPSDFIIKGAESLIEGLRDSGVKLFLVSDAELVDLERETELLEYNEFFNGGIYGALGNGDTMSKARLIEKLIKEHNLHSPEFAVITANDLELRACRKYDGLAIGMASNQVRRYGLDLQKRQLLVRAGAQLVLPDYSQWEILLNILTGE